MSKTRGHEYRRGNLQDDSSSRLVSLAFKTLNRRHVAQLNRADQAREASTPAREPRPMSAFRQADIAALVRWMTIVADEIFSETYTDLPSSGGERAPLSQHRLSRDKLMREMQHRAEWVLSHWDRRKVEGRRAGGRRSIKDGVRKGPPPRFTHADIKPFLALPAKERREQAMAETGMSRSRFYELLKAAPEIEERNAAHFAADPGNSPTQEELEALLDFANDIPELSAQPAAPDRVPLAWVEEVERDRNGEPDHDHNYDRESERT